MTQRRDYYRVLHVHPDAPDEIIKVSYRTLMQRLKMHPDLGGDHATATVINEAFRTLGHPDRRAAYDQWLLEHQGSPEPAQPESRNGSVTVEVTVELSQCHFCATPHERGVEKHPESACRTCGGSLFAVIHHQSDDDSRRAIERLPRNMLVVFARANPNDAPCRGVTQDISLSGMRFLTSSMVGIDDRLLIETEFCSATGIVRSARQRPAAQNGWEIGVQFFTMRVKHQRGSLISKLA